jgi:hypothetical protein
VSERVVHGASRGDREERVEPFGRQCGRRRDADVDPLDTRRTATDVEGRLDHEPGRVDVVPGTVPPGVVGHAAGQAGDEQLGGRRSTVVATRVRRLVGGDAVAANLRREAVAARVPDGQ